MSGDLQTSGLRSSRHETQVEKQRWPLWIMENAAHVSDNAKIVLLKQRTGYQPAGCRQRLSRLQSDLDGCRAAGWDGKRQVQKVLEAARHCAAAGTRDRRHQLPAAEEDGPCGVARARGEHGNFTQEQCKSSLRAVMRRPLGGLSTHKCAR